MATCTVYVGTTRCGKAAVVTFVGITTGETFAECEEHAVVTKVEKAEKAKATRYCRKAACVEEALGYEFVAHLAGTCGR